MKLVRSGNEMDVRAGDALQVGDVLRTGKAADGTEVVLDVQATLQLSGRANATFLRDGPFAVDLAEGRVLVSVGPQAAGHPFVIHTPHADAEVLGTRFALDVSADSTRLEVFESRVRLHTGRQPDGVVVQAGFAADARVGFQAVAVPISVENHTAVFQDGRNGYSGTRVIGITTQNAQYTYNNGSSQFDGNDILVCDFDDYQERVLLRFDELKLPPNAKVESAQLDLKWENWNAALSLRGMWLNVPWNVNATGIDGLGWLYRDKKVAWAAPGASNEKIDRIPDVSLALPIVGSGYVTPAIVPLDPARVQTWFSTPAVNNGFIFWVAKHSQYTRLFTSRAPDQERRPALIVKYTVPVGTVVPPDQRTTTKLSDQF